MEPQLEQINLLHQFQTIFQTLPWLFGIPDDEWISPQQFEQIISTEDSSVPVYSAKDGLKSETPGSWRFKNPGSIKSMKERVSILVFMYFLKYRFIVTKYK